ncbi:2TM domain-containing protein [Tamlana sp. 2_MG-2023]|uniref:2TM domain-containing protein n=1 Tax=unclassified Tamlana TaxID=2614803 RepID=UPI0026E37F62|nr:MULTISPECIES: 2TM domain-containing protein [unclassified Tamlana]MDO6758667.1 2TM domain-containing protein [Tamlana sp. 2_MG-2023]MDO6789366.1 2TM domain-containing protein [Tamlana sp. 1_MG-2023]
MESDYNHENYQKEEAYLRAEKRLKELKGFYWHAFWYVAVNIFITGMIVFNGGQFWNFGTFATPLFWGIGLAFHGLCIFGKDFVFGKSWEERKIKEYMEKEQENFQ